MFTGTFSTRSRVTFSTASTKWHCHLQASFNPMLRPPWPESFYSSLPTPSLSPPVSAKYPPFILPATRVNLFIHKYHCSVQTTFKACTPPPPGLMNSLLKLHKGVPNNLYYLASSYTSSLLPQQAPWAWSMSNVILTGSQTSSTPLLLFLLLFSKCEIHLLYSCWNHHPYRLNLNTTFP